MSEQHPESAGDLLDGKENIRREEQPELKTRRAKLLRRIREDKAKRTGEEPIAQTNNATAGDDFYADVLARFGIEI